MAAPDYGPLFEASGQTHDIDPLLLQAISMHEDASGAPNATGPANKSGERAVGVMQFLPSTAAQYSVDPNDPASSILGAGAYLAKLRKDTNDNLPAMLAQYGGGNATGYAKSVIGTYHQLQSSWGIKPSPQDDRGDTSSASPPVATSGDQGGIKITMKAAPSTFNPNADVAGHNANFTPPPPTPSDFGVSNQPGARAQHTMQASEYGNTAPQDFRTQLFGPAPAAPPKQEQPAPASAPAATTAPPADFQTQLFGPQPGAAGAPAVAPGEPEVPSDVTIPSASAPSAAPQPSWWESNVAAPVRSMYDPTQGGPMNYLLGQPLLQNIGAGMFGQGPRNVAQRFNEWEQEADQRYPWLAALDRSAGPTWSGSLTAPDIRFGGVTPETEAQRGRDLTAQTQAYRTQYGDSLAAAGGEIAGNILATAPLLEPLGWGLNAAGEAVPLARGAATVTNMAATPAGQNILTTPGQDWRTAGAQGAAGGLAVGGVLGSVAGQFASRAATQAQQDAERLGFNLTTGEYGSPFAKNVEGISAYFPGSGAAAKEAEHHAVINTVLNRNMGIGNNPVLNQATMQTARARAGNLMDQIQGVTVDANKDPNLLNELGDIHARAAAQPMTGTAVTGAVDKVLGSIDQSGMLSGDVLHNIIKKDSSLDKLIGGKDSVVSQFAQEIKNSLLDAASRGDDPAIYGPIQAAKNRVAVDNLNEGRYNWKVIKTVEPLVDKTGSGDDITYQGLASRIEGNARSGNPNFDPRFSGPNHDMDALARVLRGPLKELKSSGTGRELLTSGAIKTFIGEGGLGAGLAAFGPENFNSYLAAMAPTAATIAAGRLFRYGPGMGSSAVQAANQVFNPLASRVGYPAFVNNPLLNPPPQQQQQ